MGILNVTPDSFSDGGRYSSIDAALAHASAMVEEGAGCIDIGGESTRPGFTPVSVEDEIARVVPVVKALRKEFGDAVPLSVDTTKPEVARQALEEGATIINDVSSLLYKYIGTAFAEFRPLYVLMHSGKGDFSSTIVLDWFEDCVKEISEFLPRENVILDMGIGFHRGADDDIEGLRMIPELKKSGAPILVGASRKSFLGKITGRDVSSRLAGSVSAVALAAYLGADIVRVHDVAASLDAWKLGKAMGA